MRTKTIGTIKVLRINVRFGYGGMGFPEFGGSRYSAVTYDIFKHGRRLAVGDVEDYGDGPELDVRFEAGPKTLARILERALEGKDGSEILPYDAGYNAPLQFRSSGQYLIWRAPCGQVARVTKAEAQRLLDALQSGALD